MIAPMHAAFSSVGEKTDGRRCSRRACCDNPGLNTSSFTYVIDRGDRLCMKVSKMNLSMNIFRIHSDCQWSRVSYGACSMEIYA